MVNNQVTIIGTVTKDAQIFEGKEDAQEKVAHFSLAVDKLRGGERSADFFRFTAFGKQADVAEQYVKKGMRLAVEGHLTTGGYDKDGVHIPTVEIIVESIYFCERKKNQEQSGDQIMEVPEEMEAEMPFK